MLAGVLAPAARHRRLAPPGRRGPRLLGWTGRSWSDPGASSSRPFHARAGGVKSNPPRHVLPALIGRSRPHYADYVAARPGITEVRRGAGKNVAEAGCRQVGLATTHGGLANWVGPGRRTHKAEQ